jgi:hypothetical protein
MARPAAVEPVSNWHKLFNNFQASPQEFFTAVEQAISKRSIPDVEISRVEWRESGLASAWREYLRVSRGTFVFDICAAPFGTSFFFSWWFAVGRRSSGAATIAAILLFALLYWYMPWWLALALFLGIFVLLGAVVGQGENPLAQQIAGIPLLGRAWERLFLPTTYFRLDSRQMYQDSVHSVVMEVIDSLTEAKGFDRLPESERKPMMKEFFGK